MDWRFLIKNKEASEEWEIPFSNFSLSEELNNDRVCSVGVNVSQINEIADYYGQSFLEILSTALREIYLYEGGNLLFGGYIPEISGDSAKSEKGTITIPGKGFFSFLANRTITKSYESEDLSDIAWDLINTTQSETCGDLGITRGTNPTTRDADRSLTDKKIDKAILGISNNNVINGIDFEITSDKILNVYYPFKGEKREIILESGELGNIDYYSWRLPLIDSLCNQVKVLGDGFGEDSLAETRDAENQYKESFTLLQNILSAKDVTEIETLQDKGDKYLNYYKYPQLRLTLTLNWNRVDWFQLEPGDLVRVKIPELQIDAFQRIYKRTLDQDGNIFLTLFETV